MVFGESDHRGLYLPKRSVTAGSYTEPVGIFSPFYSSTRSRLTLLGQDSYMKCPRRVCTPHILFQALPFRFMTNDEVRALKVYLTMVRAHRKVNLWY